MGAQPTGLVELPTADSRCATTLQRDQVHDRARTTLAPSSVISSNVRAFARSAVLGCCARSAAKRAGQTMHRDARAPSSPPTPRPACVRVASVFGVSSAVCVPPCPQRVAPSAQRSTNTGLAIACSEPRHHPPQRPLPRRVPQLVYLVALPPCQRGARATHRLHQENSPAATLPVAGGWPL